MDGDQQLPDGQERDPNQEDTAYHGQEDGHGIGGCSTLWLPEDRQVGLPTGQLCIGEQHDTILGSFVETKHCLLVIFHDAVRPRDHLIFAQVLAGVVVSWAS